jgi:hypothetical protein
VEANVVWAAKKQAELPHIEFAQTFFTAGIYAALNNPTAVEQWIRKTE